MGSHRRPKPKRGDDRLGLITATVILWLLFCAVFMFAAPHGRWLHDAKTLVVAFWPW